MSAECDLIAMEDREDIEALERFHAEDDGFRIPHAIVQLKIHGTRRYTIVSIYGGFTCRHRLWRRRSRGRLRC
jgi:hypothetical protein